MGNTEKRNGILVFAFYYVTMLLFFLQYPLQGSLTGDWDTIANLAMYKQIQLFIESLFSGLPMGATNFPAEHVWAAFGADFGAGIFHLLFNLLGFNDLWANWLFISLLFASNSFGLYLLASHYIAGRYPRILAGLLFSLCQFTLGILENPNVLVFFFCFLSLYWYKKFLSGDGEKYFSFALLTGALQIYFSPYVFLFHAIAWACMILVNECRGGISSFGFRRYFLAAVAYTVLISPYLYFFVFNSPIDGWFNPVTGFGLVHILSLHPNDLWRTLPNHLLFGFTDTFSLLMITKMKSAYIGLSFWAMSIYGLIKMPAKLRLELVFIWLAGFITALGPYISWNFDRLVPSLLWPLYEYFDFGSILRMPVRAFFICIFAMSILAAFGAGQLMKGSKTVLLVPLFIIAFAIENIPMPMQVYDQENILEPDKKVIDALTAVPPASANVLHLPSFLFDDGDRREYAYMYWQSLHRQNILNGVIVFIPPVRLHNDSLMREWYKGDNLQTLIRENQLDYVIYHKDMQFAGESADLGKLVSHSNLIIMDTSSRSWIMKVKK